MGCFLVRRKGLEPPTYWFVASHSIQLSYRRIPRFRALIYNSTRGWKKQVIFLNDGTQKRTKIIQYFVHFANFPRLLEIPQYVSSIYWQGIF